MEQEVLDEEVALLGRRPVEACLNWTEARSTVRRERAVVSHERLFGGFLAYNFSVS